MRVDYALVIVQADNGTAKEAAVGVTGESARAGAVKAVIAEDEANLAEELRETLAAMWPELMICGVASDGLQALQQLEQHEPNVLFLDIHMPGISGLEVAKRASGRSHIVFVTAYDKYAVAAFQQGAVDYIMKPLEAERLADTVKRLKARVDSAPANLEGLLKALYAKLGNGRDYIRWITASQGQELRLITIEEVNYFRADNKCTLVVTSEKESLIYRPIKELSEVLDPSTFWRIHRGTIVNIRHVSGIARDYRGRLRLKLKQRTETLPVSAPYAHLFKQM
ncbi:MAG TPA: LytTR family DNA-binding domain-containing protein [Casimicrobiaceae bacterium]|nr:LytTR family DNA-binding domain-containing protein [Casimicrobiaceae bacterium]